MVISVCHLYQQLHNFKKKKEEKSMKTLSGEESLFMLGCLILSRPVGPPRKLVYHTCRGSRLSMSVQSPLACLSCCPLQCHCLWGEISSDMSASESKAKSSSYVLPSSCSFLFKAILLVIRRKNKELGTMSQTLALENNSLHSLYSHQMPA